jgi:hypothetical protein
MSRRSWTRSMTKATPVAFRWPAVRDGAVMQPACAAMTVDWSSTGSGQGLVRTPTPGSRWRGLGRAQRGRGVHDGEPALMRRLHVNALHLSGRPGVICDDPYTFEPADLSPPDRAIGLLAVAPAPTGPAIGLRAW